MDTASLVLAIPMVAGPQILSSIVLVTGRNPVRTSAAYVIAIAMTITAGLAASKLLAHLFDLRADLGGVAGPTQLGTGIQLALVALLVFLAVRSYLGRASSQPPKWLDKLQSASAGQAFLLGFLLISLMPTDLVIVLTTGFHLESEGKSFWDGLPLVVGTAALAASPLLLYLLFRERAATAMPAFRNWMKSNSWLVNIIIYVLFVALILA